MLTDEQIFDILDGTAPEEVQQEHCQLLNHSLDYKRYFQEIEALHLDLAGMVIEKPSSQFTNKLLANLQFESQTVKKKSWSSQLTYISFGVIATILIGMITFAFLYLSTTKIVLDVATNYWFETTNSFLTDTFVKLAFLANLIVLLVIFDRKVLKPYFNHRKIRLS